MQTIERFIISQTEPPQTNVVWIDSSIEIPVFKVFVSGEWKTVEQNILTPSQLDAINTYIQINSKISDFNNDIGYLTNTTLLNSQNFQKKADKTLVYNQQPYNGMLPNTLYNIGTITQDITFTFDTTVIDNTIENQWHWTFDTAGLSDTIEITWPNGIYGITMWVNSEPTISADKYYDIVVLNNVAKCTIADLPQVP